MNHGLYEKNGLSRALQTWNAGYYLSTRLYYGERRSRLRTIFAASGGNSPKQSGSTLRRETTATNLFASLTAPLVTAFSLAPILNPRTCWFEGGQLQFYQRGSLQEQPGIQLSTRRSIMLCRTPRFRRS